MADTPDDTETNHGTTSPAPRRRRTRNDAAAPKGRAGTGKRAAARKAEPASVPEKAAAVGRAARAKVAKAEEVTAKAVKPRGKRVAREVKSGAQAAAKAATRKRILVGAAAAAASVVAGIAATLGRNKIAKATGDVLEVAKGTVDTIKDKAETLSHGGERDGVADTATNEQR